MTNAVSVEDEDELISKLKTVSRSYRLQSMGLKIDGVPFNLAAYPWLIEILDIDHPHVVIRKGAQLGFTVAMVLKSIDQLMHRYSRGLLYLMPTRDDVSDFSKSRFDRMMKDNKEIASEIRDVDAAGIKRIREGFMYFRGSKSRSQLKSIPVDAVVFDERDEMEAAQVELARTRMDGSTFAEETELSTPTLPDFGIDATYKASDQRMYHWKCKRCSAWTCMELEWPECLKQQTDGQVVRICVRCKNKMSLGKGEWVASFPQRNIAGFYISQLCSPTVPTRKIFDEYNDPMHDNREFFNSRLGLGYADIEDVLDEPTLEAVMGQDPKRFSAQGPCWMGVDVGKHDLHWMVGERRSETHLETLAYGVAHEMGEIHDLSERFNVCCGVIDAMAETRVVREFLATHGGWYGCHYSDAQRTGYDFSAVQQRVAVNRTEILDHSHRQITQRRAIFPRKDSDWPEFVKHMTNIARTTIRDGQTGIPKTRWILRGAKRDHWRHAWAYGVLAAEQTPIATRARRIITPYGNGGGSRSWMAA